MKKVTFLTLMLFIVLSLSAVITETASLKAFLYGSAPQCQYDNWLSHVSEGIALANYNLYAPYDVQTNGFGDYITPTAAQLTAWDTIVTLFMQGDFTTAEIIISDNGFPYQIVIFNDTDTNRQYHMLRETLNMSYTDNNGTPDDPSDDEIGSFSNGWGLYIISTTSNNPIIVNVVHPNDDFMVTPVALKAFIDWDAKYFMVAGAGREVKWTNVTPYTNSKSLSDPSRVSAHPFNTVYRKFCDQIRTQYGRREFSAQIHSYDWNRHEGYPSLQLSAGYNNPNPNLPIRDLSSLKLDVINASDYVIFPRNSIGIHSEVDLFDYYGVHYYNNPFTYQLGDSLIVVSNNIDLPGFSQNIQQNYTLSGLTDNDVYDPFFHIEFDELPNCYPQNVNNYHWFYAYDVSSGSFNRNALFERGIEFYSKWLDAMTEILPYTLQLNDNLIPSTPQNLSYVNSGQTYIRLSWESIDCFDFKTYQILYSTSPITGDNYQIFDRTNNTALADPNCNKISITGLQAGQNYYFKIRALDYNNNYSQASQELNANTGSAVLDNVTAFADYGKIVLKWRAVSQINNQGFRVYRKTDVSDYVQIADWNSHSSLAPNTASYVNYTFEDTNVTNYLTYTYKIAYVHTNGNVFYHYETPLAQLQPIHTLYVRNQNGSIVDSLHFSKNPFATDGKDANFDVAKPTTTSGNYIWAGLYEQYWSSNGDYLGREVFGDYDVTESYKIFRVLIKSNQLSVPLVISASNSFSRNSEKLYIREMSNNTYTNLLSNNAQFTVANTNYKEFYLYWGNLNPSVNVNNSQNVLYQAGANATFYFSTTFNFLVQSHTVYIKNETDSIIVASNLPFNATSASFVIPNNINMPYAKVYVKTVALDGQIYIKGSSYNIGIVPSVLSFSIPEGNSFVANPFNTYPIELSSLPGQSLLYTYDNHQYTQSNSMIFNKGYFVHTTDSYTQNFNQSVLAFAQNQVVVSGWNLLGNPHYSTYNTKDLQFYYNNSIYSFGELVQQKVISPVVYVCRNNSYIVSDFINPHESFLIYTNLNPSHTISCYFVPFYDKGLPVVSSEIDWISSISATQIDTDEIRFGICNVKDTPFSFYTDLPEPPVKPVENPLSMYFSTNEDFLYEKINQLLKTPFNNDIAELKSWDFNMSVNSLTPITFTTNFDGLPENYKLKIIIDDIDYLFTPSNPSVTFTPQNIGVLSGVIQVGNQHVSNDNQVQKPFSVSIYPNPFNPTTNISFNLPKASDVEISLYNIKGQKVKTIINDHVKAGNHTFQWNGRDSRGNNCSSAIYFSVIKIDNSVISVKKITLLK